MQRYQMNELDEIIQRLTDYYGANLRDFLRANSGKRFKDVQKALSNINSEVAEVVKKHQ